MKKNDWPVIVGINRTQDASISVFIGGKHEVSIHKERITRKKHHWGELSDLVLYKNFLPVLNRPIDLIVECFSSDEELKNDELYEQDIYDNLLLNDNFKRIKISHHLAHSYSAFPVSGFPAAAGLIVDFQGSHKKNFTETGNFDAIPENYLEVASYYHSDRKDCKCIKKQMWDGNISRPTGLGAFYNRLSKCFFTGDANEGKVMGLCGYGNSKNVKLPGLVFMDGEILIPDEWLQLFAEPGIYSFEKSSRTFQEKADLAAKGQLEFEKGLLKMVDWLHKRTRSSNLYYAGGCALNVLANTRILQESKFKKLFIPPAPHDGGTSIGCALYGLMNVYGMKPEFAWENDYLGPVHPAGDIENIIGNYPDLILARPADLVSECADRLAEGQILALFQERSEFGPRALGNRSIIADGRFSITRDWINLTIKGREWYRPIAPMIPENEMEKYFQFKTASRYMLFSPAINKLHRKNMGAITHVDGTSRLQTIAKKDNDFVYRLLKRFKQKTGMPILTNTSFNLKGETIVETIDQAVESFSKKPFHALVIPPFLLTKKRPPVNPLQASEFLLC
jgi:carbamoyltransferase